MQIDNNFQTPYWCREYMISLIKNETEIKTVLEPTPGEGNLVDALKKQGFFVTVPKSGVIDISFWDYIIHYPYFIKWDAIVMNPPATPMQAAYNIFYECMKHTDRMVALMPWLTIINSQKRTKDIMDFGLISVTHLPRSTFKGSRIQTCILNMKRGYKGKTKFKVIGHGIEK